MGGELQSNFVERRLPFGHTAKTDPRPIAGTVIDEIVVTAPKLHNDSEADSLWRRCAKDDDLKWLLGAVLDSRTRTAGQVLLLNPTEFFDEVQVRAGVKLSLQFRLTGLPYLSQSFRRLLWALDRVNTHRSAENRQSTDSRTAITEWTETNSRQALDLLVKALLETVRRNTILKTLASSEDAVTVHRVRRAIPAYDFLDWTPMEELLDLCEPFLKRARSKKLINRFTLNLTALLPYFQPEIVQEDVVVRSAKHFVNLLKTRSVSEGAWRKLFFDLLDREMVIPCTCMFLWCPRCPQGGFVASGSLSFGKLPPLCPSCGSLAYAMASFAPDGALLRAMRLKDGLLGAAIGWHLKTSRIPFWHSLRVKDTEIDFITKRPQGHVLIESKMLHVSRAAKQLARNIREALEQLNAHAQLLKSNEWKLHKMICVVNLSQRELNTLRRSSVSLGPNAGNLVSYERFAQWVHQHA